MKEEEQSNYYRRKFFWLLVIIVAINNKSLAQDPHFSQYYSVPLYLNPALAGLEEVTYVGFNYRNQWRSLGFSQNTGQLSVMVPWFGKGRQTRIGTWSGSVSSDVLGENNNFRTTGANLGFTYNVRVNESQLVIVAMQGGYLNKRIDASQLQWGSQYDPYTGFNSSVSPSATNLINQVSVPVLNAGAAWFFNAAQEGELTGWKGFAGVAISNLNQPDQSMIERQVSRLPILYKWHGGLEWNVSPQVSLLPNLLVMRQNKEMEMNMGMYLNYKINALQGNQLLPIQISIGSWYRVGDAYILSAGAAARRYSLGFSYDINTSSLRYSSQGRGAYEFSMAYRFTKNNTIRRFSTPLL